MLREKFVSAFTSVSHDFYPGENLFSFIGYIFRGAKQ